MMGTCTTGVKGFFLWLLQSHSGWQSSVPIPIGVGLAIGIEIEPEKADTDTDPGL